MNLILNSIQSIEKDQGKITIHLEKEDEYDRITIEVPIKDADEEFLTYPPHQENCLCIIFK